MILQTPPPRKRAPGRGKIKMDEKFPVYRFYYIPLPPKRHDVRHKIYAICRAERFSPNSVNKDAAILESVAMRLGTIGYNVETVDETRFTYTPDAAACLSMGRGCEVLAVLKKMESEGVVVMNSPLSVEVCKKRKLLNSVMERAGITLPPPNGDAGYWLKRADGTAEAAVDVRYVEDHDAMLATYESMRAAGIRDIIVQAHVTGDLIKFYGVRGTSFFFTCYPGDDGDWKFADEARNGKPHHYPYGREALRRMVEKVSEATGATIYGGDCIVDSNGAATIIDFNDWPSFYRCKEEAAEAIVEIVTRRIDAQKA